MMIKIRDVVLKISLATILFAFIGFVPAGAVTYKYVPLKENASKLEQLKVKSISSFKSYKVVVSMDKLKIRKKPLTKGLSTGVYRLGNIVEIIGKTGSFLKTNKGYITVANTKKISGMSFVAVKDIKIIRTSNLKEDNRTVQTGKTYRIIDTKGGYLKVKLGSVYGYVPLNTIRSISDLDNTKITVGWEYLNKKSSNETFLSDPRSYVNTKSKDIGLDVISPTWFDMTGSVTSPSSIQILDIANKNYVDAAHKNGYEIWARFCEMDKKRATVIFNNSSVRARLIEQIVKLSVQYDIDGINVDFEALGKENKEGFNAFMKELFPKLKKYNLNVSVDITKISLNSSLYSLCYDRPELAKYSDYLMLMAYDEHYSSSKDAGSVGSYNWVEEAITDIINEGVSPKKLILGAPFYLRDFTVVPYDAVFANQKINVYSSTNGSEVKKLGDARKDESFKCTGSYSNWYVINYNGINGYVLKADTQFYKANTTITTGSAIDTTTGAGVNIGQGGGAINLVITEDTVVLNKDVAIYSSSTDGKAGILGEANTVDYYKYLGKNDSWNIIEYKGIKGYVKIAQSSYYKANSRAVGSASISMQSALDRVINNNGTITFDNIAKQNVGTYLKDGLKHYVWLETADSMKWRMSFVNKYNLPGAAVWSLYWKPTDGIWNAIKSTLHK
jgi:spore germination protein YaaH